MGIWEDVSYLGCIDPNKTKKEPKKSVFSLGRIGDFWKGCPYRYSFIGRGGPLRTMSGQRGKMHPADKLQFETQLSLKDGEGGNSGKRKKFGSG